MWIALGPRSHHFPDLLAVDAVRLIHASPIPRLALPVLAPFGFVVLGDALTVSSPSLPHCTAVTLG